MGNDPPLVVSSDNNPHQTFGLCFLLSLPRLYLSPSLSLMSPIPWTFEDDMIS
jgi:hypothetical protein